MSDIKRTFLAGLVVAGILLLMPFYFNLIGYNNLSSNSDNNNLSQNIQEEKKQPFDAPKKDLVNLPLPSSSGSGVPEKQYMISNNKFSAILSNVSGGSLLRYELDQSVPQFLGGYNEGGQYDALAPVSLILDTQKKCAPCIQTVDQNGRAVLHETPFELVTNSNFDPDIAQRLVFESVHIKDFVIRKTVTLAHDSFVINHFVDIKTNKGDIASVGLVWDKGLRNTERNIQDEISYSLSSIAVNKTIENIALTPKNLSDIIEEKTYDNADWAAIRNKYFIMAFVPKKPALASHSSSTFRLNDETLVPSYATSIAVNSSTLDCDLFLGPLDLDEINKLDVYLDRIMNFGWFLLQPFSRSVLWLLKFLHGFGLNYGIILILFAFIVRFVTGPLTKKSHKSAQKMQELQPQLKKLQEKHKKNPQRLNQETVKLYKNSGTNPLGGCFPMLLQMPLLFSLFIVFRSTIEFRGAPFFGWISNLSQPDTIINLPINIPLYGDQIAFLPILLGVTMFLSQRISMSTMDPKQKPFMYIMSGFFYLIFNSFPSGLNLYYVVYNILNYMQQKTLKKSL